MRPRALLLIFGISLVSLLLLDHAAGWARATSGGSRGSRSSSSPAAPSTPSSPSRTTAPGARSVPADAAGAAWPGYVRRLHGRSRRVRRGRAHRLHAVRRHGWWFGGGLGLLEMLLIGGAIFFVFRMLRSRSQAPAYAGAAAYGSGSQGWSTGGGGTVMETPPGESDLDRGIGHIRSMDASFDPAAFAEWAKRWEAATPAQRDRQA